MIWGADSVSAVVGIGALIVSGFALLISRRADARAKFAARTQIYLTLRSRFLEIYERLPPSYQDPSWRPTSQAEKAAANRYWQHAFDEWYITKHLDPALLGSLWNDFFAGALRSGLRRDGLRFYFSEIRHSRAQNDSNWGKFAAEVEQAWLSTHQDKADPCKGFCCEARHET